MATLRKSNSKWHVQIRHAGHHHSAAALRVAAKRRGENGSPHASHESFLSVNFPDDEVMILDDNRVVKDLNGLDSASFLARLEDAFLVTPADQPVRPTHPASFGLYLDGHWYVLALKNPPGPDADQIMPPKSTWFEPKLADGLLSLVLD